MSTQREIQEANQGKEPYFPTSRRPGPIAGDRVKRVVRTTAEDLRAVNGGSILAIVVPEFVSDEDRSEALKRVLNMELRGYHDEPALKYGGAALSDSKGRPDERARYFDEADSTFDEVRRASNGIVDKMLAHLTAGWTPGLRRLVLSGRRTNGAICRVWREGAQGGAHEDRLRRDGDGDPDAIDLHQLSALVYLETADTGGELALWATSYPDDAEFESMRDPASTYAFDEDLLPSAAVTIKPNAGDLILFSTLRPHAVRRITSGRRTTISFFVGFNSPNDSGLVWA